MKNIDYDSLIQPIIDLYSEIEIRLLLEIAERFKTYDSVSGSLEWYSQKLNELGGLNKESISIISKYSKKTEKEIYEALKKVGIESIDKERLINAYNQNAISINPSNLYDSITINNVIENSFKDTKDIFKMINTKAIESVKKEYTQVLNTAYLEVSSGIYDYNTSISRALQNMAKNGIKEATYESGRTYSLEGAVRRDILTALNQTACKVQEKVADEIKAEYYYVSEHLGARTNGEGYKNHASWQGKVYKINGFDKKYDNFYTVTGYGTIEGLAGVNCRHMFWVFFPDIEEVPKSIIDNKENEKIYELNKQQRLLERKIRIDKKKMEIAKVTNDNVSFGKAKQLLYKHQEEMKQFITDNPKLKRKYERERITKV